MVADNRRSFGIHLSATVADELQHMKTSLKDNWDDPIPMALLANRETKQSSTGISQF